jgi:predicted ATPase
VTAIVKTLSIQGYRGFATKQELSLANPDGKPGSGLTVLIGPNSAGKSTIYESLLMFGDQQPRRFPEGRRNASAASRASIKLSTAGGGWMAIDTHPDGGSTSVRTYANEEATSLGGNIYAVPSRRSFDAFFGAQEYTRETYASTVVGATQRQSSQHAFAFRLYSNLADPGKRAAFDAELAKILPSSPKWLIDETEQGQAYLKVVRKDGHHSSEGLGEGTISLLFLVDALYDAPAGSLIVVDEPELSLHPSLQRRVAAAIVEHSSNKQIVVATHSPYFVPVESLGNGARIARVHWTNSGSTISSLSDATAALLPRYLASYANPHIVGLDARDAFFLEDCVILVEGQEDRVLFPAVFDQLNGHPDASYFGWGVGGASNMEVFAALFSELGFAKVVGILDADKASLVPALTAQFPKYRFIAQPADDIRDKDAQTRNAKSGLVDKDLVIKPSHLKAAQTMASEIDKYLALAPAS